MKERLREVLESHEMDILDVENMSVFIADVMDVYINHLKENEPYAINTIKQYENAKQSVESLYCDVLSEIDYETEL